MKLTQCEVTRKVASNFFKNLYSLRNLEKFEIDDSSIIHIPEKEKFPKHLFLPKLKTFEIEFRKKWKDKTKDEGYENHQGYGNMGTYWLDYNLPTIYNFPNFEKFKSLEKINLYNLFSEETPEGQLFNSAYTNYLKKFEDMGTKVKNFNKLKHIWIHGFELKGDISHQSKNVQECLEALTKHKKVLINGKNIKTTKLNLKGIKKLELICKIEQYWDPKLISQDKDKIILNYFPNIENKEKRDLLNNCLAQKLEEIKVKPAYQFFKSENVWSDTFKPIEDHIKKNKNLKNIIFEFDENFVSEDYGDMVGEWSEWESKTFAIFVKNNLEKNKNLKIKISHPEFNQNFDREKVYNKYIRLLNLYSVINKDKKFSGRLLINELNKGNIENVLLKYYNEKVTSIVIIEDNCGYNSSKKINNIELLEKSDFEFQNPKINAYMEEFPVFDKDRYNPLDSFFEERFWRYASAHDDDNNYNHIWNRLSYEEPIIFVKKDYLDSYKKTLFGNIQHLYYHCIKNFDDETEQSPIFWNKNEKFKIPSSVKVKNLETLHLFSGRDITLEDVNKICGKTIKYLILEDKLVGNYSLPYMPKLEKLIVGQGWDGFKKFSSNFSKLSNIPNIFELGLRLDYDNTSSHLDLSDYKGSGKLKKLSIEHLNPKFTHHLKKLTSLEDLNISLWNEKERVIEKDFEFVKSLKNLIKIKISGGIHASVFINYAKLMEYISPNIQELECDIVYKEDDHQVVYKCIKKIISKFKKLKKLKIDCNSCFIDNELRSGEVFNYKNYKYNYNSKTNTFTNLKTKEKFKEGMFKNKLIFDFKKFKKLKNLEEIYLSGDHKAGYILKNENEILTAKKLIRIKFPTKNFSSKLLKKIKQRLDNYLNKCRKLKKYKSKTISSEYSLEDKERKEYLSMDIKFGYGWGETAEAILEERQKKKNSNA